MMDEINAAAGEGSSAGGGSGDGDAQHLRDADFEFRRLCSDFTLQTNKEGFFKDYLATIAEQVSPEEFEGFCLQKSNRQKFLYCWTLPAIHRVLPAVRPAYRMKNTEESIKRRQQGNQHFQEGEYRESLILYNQSVIHAPYSSVMDKTTLALALANRSAALVHLKKYHLAVNDIQLALQSSYPETQRYKLYDRLGFCHQQLGDYVKARTAFSVALSCLNEADMLMPDAVENWRNKLEKSRDKLSDAALSNNSNSNTDDKVMTPNEPTLLGGPHSQLPVASRHLALECDDYAGRFFRAADDIKAGQTLVCEKPYAAALLPDKFKSHCHHCFVRLIAPVGCTRCRGLGYCSVECRDEANSTYHQYECGITDILISSGVSILSWLALRIVTQTKLDDFSAICSPLMGKDELDQGEKLGSEEYDRIYRLVTLSDQRSSKDHFDRTLMAIFLFQCLRATGYFEQHQSQDAQSITEQEVLIGTLILRHLQQMQFNAHEIHDFLQLNEKSMRTTKTVYCGVGVYPTVAYFNHSCRPDVARYFLGTKLVITSSRPISRGQPVYENYGPIFTHKTKSDRQRSLKGRYWFECRCRPCRADWPGYDCMPSLETVLSGCCPQCGESSCLSQHPSAPAYARCSRCKKQSPWEAVQRPTEEMTKLYQTAMQLMDQAQVEKAVQLLCLFIDMLDRLVETLKPPPAPIRELYLAQEALRLCVGTFGTKYSANNHLALKVVPNNK